LADIPVLGNLTAGSSESQIRDVLELVRHSARGGGIWVVLGTRDAAAVATLGKRIAAVLGDTAFPATHPLVLLMPENLGKVLGHYVTRWGTRPQRLVVLDEIAVRNAQYVQIGKPCSHVVPVSFYGLNEQGELP
jgi:ethanolamine utilization protein EutA (predicted chaperonin)